MAWVQRREAELAAAQGQGVKRCAPLCQFSMWMVRVWPGTLTRQAYGWSAPETRRREAPSRIGRLRLGRRRRGAHPMGAAHLGHERLEPPARVIQAVVEANRARAVAGRGQVDSNANRATWPQAGAVLGGVATARSSGTTASPTQSPRRNRSSPGRDARRGSTAPGAHRGRCKRELEVRPKWRVHADWMV